MVVRLVIYLIMGLVLLVGSGALTFMGWLWFKPEVKGKLNVKKQAVLDRQCCKFCDEPTNENVDMFEDHIGWYHRFCMKRLLGS